MIAVVHKHKAAIANIFFKILPLFGRELNQLVTTQIAKGTAENFITAQGHNVFLRVDLQGGVFNQRVQHIYGHPLINIPISRFVLQSCKEEFAVIWHAA